MMEKHFKQPANSLSFEEIIEGNKAKIFRICRIYATRPVEPEDLFQEVVFQAWKSFASFKGQSTIATWMYRIALNVCMNAKLKHDKKNNKTTHLESVRFEYPAESRHFEDEERYRALKVCIDELSEADKSIVVLYLEELAYKEIATITGLTENHVAVKMKRIRKKLFDCITQKLA